MNKLRKRLSKWFLDTAKKLDSDAVNDNCAIIEHITMYDHHNVDRICAQHEISNVTLDPYRSFIEERIPEILTRAIAEEIMKTYKSEIKKTQLASMDNLLYSLDVYVCKPQKKESLL